MSQATLPLTADAARSLRSMPRPRNVAAATYHFLNEPTGLLRRYAQRYPDPFALPLPGVTQVVTGEPSAVREIFSADPDLFEPPADLLKALLTDDSILLMAGGKHRRKRKLLAPPFHGARMRAYGQTIQEAALRYAARWEPGRRFVLLCDTEAISEEVILQAVFGIRERERIERIKAAIDQTMRVFSPILVYLPFLQRDFGGRGPWSRYVQSTDAQKQLLLDEIARHRSDAADREDVLSLLLATRDDEGRPMSDDELVDELRTLLFAGYETTATTLAWAFYEVHRSPSVLARLLAEVAPLGPRPDPEALARLPYLSAICDETLRIHPIGAGTLRRLTRPWTFRGYALPKGTLLTTAMSITHFREDLYPEPDAFRPERFLERQFQPFEYYPFGGGNRRCIGAAFAVYEMKIVLGTILASHRLALASDRPVVPISKGLTMRPDGGVEMRLVERLHSIEA